MISVFTLCSSIIVAAVTIFIGLAISDGRYLLDVLNRFVFPRGPLIVTSKEHVAWRNMTRKAVGTIRMELKEWESLGNSFPEFYSITPIEYFPEADKETYGKDQKRPWGFVWLQLYGTETKLAAQFPELMSLYDSLPGVEIYSIAITVLYPGRGDVTHFGEFRGTWRQLLTIEEPSQGTARLGIYPYGEDSSLCDSIWTPPEFFQERCQPSMKAPLIHEYHEGKDILFDDTVWHFIDNDATEGRRVAIWVDVVRTDLNLWQRLVLRLFIFIAANMDEVADMVKLVNGLDYKKLAKTDEIHLVDSAPRGPVEVYDKTNVIDVDVGFYD